MPGLFFAMAVAVTWPIASDGAAFPGDAAITRYFRFSKRGDGFDVSKPFSGKDIVGKWTHRVDFGRPSEVELLSGGAAKNGEQRGTLRWPRADAPNEPWIDRLTAYDARNGARVAILGRRR